MWVAAMEVQFWLFMTTPTNMVYPAKLATIIKPKTKSALHSISVAHAPDTKVATLLRTTSSRESASLVSRLITLLASSPARGFLLGNTPTRNHGSCMHFLNGAYS